MAWTMPGLALIWCSFQTMEAEQGPGIQAGFPQIDLAANFAAMTEAGPSQESPVAENWCFTQVNQTKASSHPDPEKRLR